MKVKVFQTNSNGKIELTCEELEKLLNETYENGRVDGHCDGYCKGIKSQTFIWDSPTLTTTNVCEDSTCADNTGDKVAENATNDNTPIPAKRRKHYPDIDGVLNSLFDKEADNIFAQLAKELASE